MTASGSFEVLGRVAVTASGTVWKARDTVLDRLVALKEIAAPDEAAALATLDSPHIVAVYRVVEDGERTLLVEEWVEGATLAAILRTSGKLETAQALGVMRGALLGLGAVHRAGLVHGDISASNVLVDAGGVAKLIDFGSVARVGGPVQPTTGAFAAPEVSTGAAATPAADVYAAAAVLAMLMHGRAERRPSTRGVDPQIRPVLDKALAADPADRYPDATAFLAALDDSATRRYGAAWWTQAGTGALATAATGAVIAPGPHAPFTGKGSIVADAPKEHEQTAVLAVESAAERRRPTKWLVGAGLVAILIGALVAVLVSNGSGAKHAAAPARGASSSPLFTSSTSTAAQAPSPDAGFTGTYSATETVESIAVPYMKVGTVRHRSWRVSAHCNGPSCLATVHITGGRIPTVGMRWTGKAWTGTARVTNGTAIDPAGSAWMAGPHHAALCVGSARMMAPGDMETITYTVDGANLATSTSRTLRGRIVDVITGVCIANRISYSLTLTRTS